MHSLNERSLYSTQLNIVQLFKQISLEIESGDYKNCRLWVDLFIYRTKEGLGHPAGERFIINKIFQDVKNNADRIIENCKQESIIDKVAYSRALTLRGVIYLLLEDDPLSAKALYEEAVELGDSNAMNSLAFMYSSGKGCEQNHVAAFAFYDRAIALGNSVAMTNLAYIYYNFFSSDGYYYEQAKNLYEQAMEQGNSNAMNALAVMYSSEANTQMDYVKSVEICNRAIRLNNSSAMVNLAYMYFYGKGCEKSYQEAKHLYEKAVELGNANAMISLANMYRNGLGCEVNLSKVIELYRKAVELNNNIAMNDLAYCYANGIGCEIDLLEAENLYLRAIEYNNSDAMVGLAHMYATYYAQEKEWEVMELYERAASLGNSVAIQVLSRRNSQNSSADDIDEEEVFEVLSTANLRKLEKAQNMLPKVWGALLMNEHLSDDNMQLLHQYCDKEIFQLLRDDSSFTVAQLEDMSDANHAIAVVLGAKTNADLFFARNRYYLQLKELIQTRKLADVAAEEQMPSSPLVA